MDQARREWFGFCLRTEKRILNTSVLLALRGDETDDRRLEADCVEGSCGLFALRSTPGPKGTTPKEFQ